MPATGAIIFRPHSFGVELNERGDPVIVGQDQETGLTIGIETTPDAFKAMLAAGARLRGIGIAVENRVRVVGADEVEHVVEQLSKTNGG